MRHYRATDRASGDVVEYDAALPQDEHRDEAAWLLEDVSDAVPDPETQPPQDTRIYGGRRRLTKLEFIGLLTDTEYVTILAAARESVPIEAWVEKMKLATPEADGTSVDLDDPRTQGGVQGLELIGLIGEGRAEEILRG